MQKIYKKIAFILWLGVMFFILPYSCLADRIDKFEVIIRIEQDASLLITETIDYDFGTDVKHGIYRDIPVKYRARGGNYTLDLSGIEIKDEKGKAVTFQEIHFGNEKRIKIGDADKTITGKHVYEIKYKIKNALNFFKESDELYWNVTGNGWLVPISKISAKVILPSSINKNNVKSECFAGPEGSFDKCSKQGLIQDGDLADAAEFHQDQLAPGEGLTVVVGFSGSLVDRPTFIETAVKRLKDNLILFMPIVVFFALLWLWYKRGRDPQGRGTIIAQFDVPDRLSPPEAGAIIDGNVNNYDISADLIGLAVKGYLRITRLTEDKLLYQKTDYLFEQLKESNSLENDFEKELLDKLFEGKGKKNGEKSGDALAEVKISDLKENFYKEYRLIKSKIYESIVRKGYFVKNPEKVIRIYILSGIAVIVIGVFMNASIGFFGSLAFALSGILVMAFGFIMPRMTKKGAETKEYLLGLKKYLEVAEKDRLDFHNAPEKDPKIFEKLLPYAIVFKVEEKWAKQFEGIYQGQPSWYRDSQNPSFTPMLLVSSIHNFNSTASSSLSAVPHSSAASGGSGFSGGSSGGGFGGGGGGSW